MRDDGALELDEWALHLLLAVIEGRVRITQQSISFGGFAAPPTQITQSYHIEVRGYVDEHGEGAMGNT